MILVKIWKVTKFSIAIFSLILLDSCDRDRITFACPTVEISSSLPLTKVPINPQRDRVYLNGIWQFIPAISQSENLPPQEGWGKIQVPGDWQAENLDSVPGILERGMGQAWDRFNGKTLSKAWYRKTIKIPDNWRDRSIVLSVDRLSTDAEIYIDRTPCGAIASPYGAVEITEKVEAGREITLELLVVAAKDEEEKTVIMTPNEIFTTQSELESKGIIGEVSLLSYPRGAHISDIFVQPSIRDRTIKLDVELTNISRSTEVKITAKLFNEAGKLEKEFTSLAQIRKKIKQNLELIWDWKNPRLWDLEKPNLYTLRLEIEGEGIRDRYDQSFGFREFWIEGKKFYLNGTEIRFRPTLYQDSWQGWGVGNPRVIDGRIEGYLKTGYNIAMAWPWNHFERGRWHFRHLLAERADLKGFPLIIPALDAVRDGYPDRWRWGGKKEWEAKMLRELRRDRNHPSILLWANSPNYFGNSDDQNPRHLGIKNFAGGLTRIENERIDKIRPIANDILQTIKQYDPTRPVMMHQGAFFGDIYALNSYLNLIPLQEREEWLSHWQEFGEMPYMVVEFGTPLHPTMMRGRNGFGGAILSEPLLTEFSAIYLGNEAYQLETSTYRQKIEDYFLGEQQYKNFHGQSELFFAPAFQQLQNLFINNTWRSWRTMGITGGMIPWEDAQGWEITSNGRETIDIETFKEGHRGVYLDRLEKRLFNYLQPPEYYLYLAANALLANNAETLVWIAGFPNFTSKDRNFKSGEILEKQLILINDSREEKPFSLVWEINAREKKIITGEKQGRIQPAQTLFFPINTDLPTVLTKTNGKIQLNAKIGDRLHSDTFNFRIFPPVEKSDRRVTIFDPVGKTTEMLQSLGFQIGDREMNKDSLLIIGREALSTQTKIPIDLESFVKEGGRVLIFTQKPNWFADRANFRVAKHLSRRVFPVNSNHPILRGLDRLDLRDWRGESTLIDAYPNPLNTQREWTANGTPKYGWHWSNRGTVSSAMLEKPHLSSWRPILEGEFDLAYSPLLELDYGKGRVILCTLDLEDFALKDPATDRIIRQIINYAATAPLTEKSDRVIFLGHSRDAAQLDELGLIYQQANQLKSNADLAIIGDRIQLDEEELKAYLQQGGKIFFLPRVYSILGIDFKTVENFGYSLNIPKWQELKGLSISDLRSRTDYSARVVASGGEIGANGGLSRIKLGKGTAIFYQFDRDRLSADKRTYLRYTRWRYTRSMVQILANLGASFAGDRAIFEAISQQQSSLSLYHPDYREDFELGDDPYRYYRW
ncbi:MAG: beta-galactosidase [Cyanobacteria bacterium SBLK]|nr:beta-galactosidase [Cyanobacteria bacterium SBLK]